MPSATILFHRLARQEYHKAFRWYARHSLRVALGFETEVDYALQRIAANPVRWPVYHGSDHFLRVKRYSYVPDYRIVDPTRVLIIALAHTSRRPGYWRRRKGP